MKFSKFLQNNFETIAVNSATSGLHLALEALGIKYGDEVAELSVTKIFVDSGRMLKRMQPAPQGRAHRIRKRSNHVTLMVGLIDKI